MNWNSPLGISIYLAFSTGVLSLSQAWILGSHTMRWPRYLIALIGSALLLAFAGGLILDAWNGQGAVAGAMRRALFIAGLVIAGVGFWIGALRRGAQAAQEQTLLGRMRVVYGTHFAVVFFGSAIALLVIVLVGLSNVRW
jgi:hypothetical protein